ncbi:DNA-binding GntR family transcriptional regulator [Acidovorax soli]|jgi:DNA-binding GntR family transcriptional regulator|uniref:DNA-binding GntR family transcriptional regulator n=1 Tax=Acidovorax soli TaxID=592050 RepID=A0A7X0PLB2_9BURK|nr:GntR family transcriptional regulator [Acidovorax soli]MBB6564050.1 DNA-binding GntR family transcriptional regulator [Acidovorax soli]
MRSRTTKPRALHQVIRDALRNDILSGKLPAGHQLRQDALATQFNASRIPVREALRQLESEGLVVHHLNRGAMVAGMNVQQICELLDIRVALECHAARLAVPNMVERDFETMERILDEYSRSDVVSDWAEYNRQFHLALSAPANNMRLKRLIEEYCLNTDRYTHLAMSTATGKDKPQSDHYQLVAACRARDVTKVVTLLEEHIDNTRKELLATAREQQMQGEDSNGQLQLG